MTALIGARRLCRKIEKSFRLPPIEPVNSSVQLPHFNHRNLIPIKKFLFCKNDPIADDFGELEGTEGTILLAVKIVVTP